MVSFLPQLCHAARHLRCAWDVLGAQDVLVRTIRPSCHFTLLLLLLLSQPEVGGPRAQAWGPSFLYHPPSHSMGMNLTYNFKAIYAVTTPKCLSLALTFPMDPNPTSSFRPSLRLDQGAGLGAFQAPHLPLSQASPCQPATTPVLQVLRPKTQASCFLSQSSSNLPENPTGSTFNTQ